MGIISTIIAGFIVGLLARAIKPGANPMGWVMTIILGVVGAVVGGFLASALNLSANGGFGGLVLSVIGAIIVLFIYEFATGKKRLK
ncbi:GlsB/YeaQ/YmgE family stress response membrane protein [Moraxella lacunata]|uniref:GlsB/YeaQ/YmgE family stress response membrane protein n=1 Tax=Moraxella lacunata TaxID=477 RepID=UPI00247FF2EE|nr:GlsB/YeaQ/YmgE family stress response membrane protein [Moraxella lacunata]MDH9219111.1 GlsB/YeaQ/YmgE family stress response membrane protein [Moraxella lacunata]